MKLYNGDCLIENEQIESGSVDLILTDLPYGTVKGAKFYDYCDGCNWDNAINPIDVFNIANRILRKNGKMVLFSQEPYTSRLITNAIPNIPFSYRMIWEKDNFANALLCNKAPVGMFEDILVFSKNYDTEDLHPLRGYLRKCKDKSNLKNRDFDLLYMKYYNKTGQVKRNLDHYWRGTQFILPTKETYENVLQPTGFFPKKWEELKAIDDNFKQQYASTFNLWQGGKYKSNILKYKKDYNGYHPTQKPVLLLEDLIKTFSNEGDLVVDLTAGSFSTGVAAIKTNRDFIGIEKDENYYKIGVERCNNIQYELF